MVSHLIATLQFTALAVVEGKKRHYCNASFLTSEAMTVKQAAELWDALIAAYQAKRREIDQRNKEASC